MALKVGDIVVVKSKGPFTSWDAENVAGKSGTVVKENSPDDTFYIVRFPDWEGGHGENHNEWCIRTEDIDYALPVLPATEKSILPADAKERKQIPIGTGVIDYFPSALAEIAKVSFAGNLQHNPGEKLHWSRDKSQDHEDAIIRHYLDRGNLDPDGQRHSAKLAWRALALLQLELESEGYPVARGAK